MSPSPDMSGVHIKRGNLDTDNGHRGKKKKNKHLNGEISLEEN